MSVNTTPVFSESTLVAIQRIAAGANPTVRATLDLTGKYGATIFSRIGRNNTTALGVACSVLIRRVIGGSSGTRIHPASGNNRTSSTAAATGSSTVSVDAAIGATTLTVASGTGFAAGDIIKIENGSDSASGTVFTRTEFARVSKVATNVLSLDAPLQFAHAAANADTVINGADAFTPVTISPGSLVEVIFDFGAGATGGPITVELVANIYNNDVTG